MLFQIRLYFCRFLQFFVGLRQHLLNFGFITGDFITDWLLKLISVLWALEHNLVVAFQHESYPVEFCKLLVLTFNFQLQGHAFRHNEHLIDVPLELVLRWFRVYFAEASMNAYFSIAFNVADASFELEHRFRQFSLISVVKTFVG